MKAVILTEQGGPEVLRIGSVPETELEPHDIRIMVAAAAINPVDLKTRSGFLSDIVLNYPAVLGWDVSGVVIECGASVTRFAVGSRVIGMVAQPAHWYGTYAERVSAPESLFAPAPATMALDDAAAIPLGALTAAQTISTLTRPLGDSILVTGGNGAVGRIAVQLLRRGGHQVDALARKFDTDELISLGVDRVFTSAADLPPAHYGAVVDTAGISQSITSVRENGQFVSIDDNEQPTATRGITPQKSYVNENGVVLEEISTLIADGFLSVPIARKYSFEDAAKAHTDFGGGAIRGKVLIIP